MVADAPSSTTEYARSLNWTWLGYFKPPPPSEQAVVMSARINRGAGSRRMVSSLSRDHRLKPGVQI
jgi:hypothetical protein